MEIVKLEGQYFQTILIQHDICRQKLAYALKLHWVHDLGCVMKDRDERESRKDCVRVIK